MTTTMINKMWKFIFLISILFGFPLASASAQQPLGIAATVNDEMISVLDLQSRIALVAGFSGFKNTPETQNRLAPQVIQTLINERIQIQEAKRLGLSALKNELDVERASIARQIKLDPSQLTGALESNGIDPTTLTDQLEARILWAKLVRSKYSRTVVVGDEEIDEIIEDVRASKGKPEYLISEIFLTGDTPEKAEENKNLAARLIQQIKEGANFSAIANNFSQSLTAQAGGNLGWNQASKIGADIRSTVESLEAGAVSVPVQTEDGVYILHLRAKRVSRGLDGPPQGPTKVTLHQLHLAANPNSPPALLEGLKNRALNLTSNIQGCQAFDEVAKQHGSPLSGELGTFEVDKISKNMQTIVVGLEVGNPSAPQITGDGVLVLMVCAREAPEVTPVDMEKVRENVRNQIFSEQINLSARRHLRDLRRAAFIDIRL